MGLRVLACAGMVRLHVTVPEELVERIDADRGDVPRSTWVRRAAEGALDGEPAASTEALPDAGVASRAAAPAPAPRRAPDAGDVLVRKAQELRAAEEEGQGEDEQAGRVAAPAPSPSEVPVTPASPRRSHGSPSSSLANFEKRG